MAIAERTAETTWEGGLARGHGTIRPASDAFDELPVTWAARTEAPDGKTSPEELAAAAHSSCFAMALSLCLGERNIEAEKLTVSSTVTLDEVDGRPTVVSSALVVTGRVPGLDAEGFRVGGGRGGRAVPDLLALRRRHDHRQLRPGVRRVG